MQATTPTTTSQPKPRVRRGSRPYIFHIESKTRPGRFHVADAHRLTCTCEAGRAGRGCWHLRLALAAYDWIKRQQAKAVSVPVPLVPATAAFGVGRSAFGGAAGGQPLAVPVVRTPNAEEQTPSVADDWHTSAAYRGLAAAFGE